MNLWSIAFGFKFLLLPKLNFNLPIADELDFCCFVRRVKEKKVFKQIFFSHLFFFIVKQKKIFWWDIFLIELAFFEGQNLSGIRWDEVNVHMLIIGWENQRTEALKALCLLTYVLMRATIEVWSINSRRSADDHNWVWMNTSDQCFPIFSPVAKYQSKLFFLSRLFPISVHQSAQLRFVREIGKIEKGCFSIFIAPLDLASAAVVYDHNLYA